MGEIALAVAASHAPGLIGMLNEAPAESRNIVTTAYGKIAQEIRDADLDVLVMVANDHVGNNRIREYPDLLIGLAELHEGPFEWFKGWLGTEDYALPGSPHIAESLFNGLNKRGIRASARRENLRFDDNISVPTVRTELVSSGVPIVPILQNVTVPPIPDQFRCYEIGLALRAIIETELPAGTRVGLFATGGLSHEPGGKRDFWIDEEFDRWFLELLREGDHQRILKEVTLETMEEAGSGGTAELLSWLLVMAAAGETDCTILGYTAWDQWRCGIGAVSWDVRADESDNGDRSF